MRSLIFLMLIVGAPLSALDALDRGDPPMLISGNSTAAAPAPVVSRYSADNPPQRFRGNASLRITFMDPSAIGAACGDPQFIACESVRSSGAAVIISNPCLELGQSYAQRLCHELGHVNGWPAMHGD